MGPYRCAVDPGIDKDTLSSNCIALTKQFLRAQQAAAPRHEPTANLEVSTSQTSQKGVRLSRIQSACLMVKAGRYLTRDLMRATSETGVLRRQAAGVMLG